MKTTIFMVMATLMLASCSKNEVSEGMPTANDPNKISFNSSTGVTRAVDNGLTQVQGGFNVLGFKNGIADPFIDGTKVDAEYKFSNPAWAWSNLSGKEWPTVIGEYPLTFYAEFPQADMSAIKTDLNKAIEIDLSMSAQTDFLVAKSSVANRPPTGFAPLNFKHILSNLVFKIKTAKGYTVHIQSIRVVNTAKAGRTFDYKTMAYEGIEPTYAPANLASTDGTYNVTEGFFFNKNTAGNTPWSFNANKTEAEQVGEVLAESGIMMQMPQKTVAYWTAGNGGNGLGKFATDATAWKNGNSTGETKLNAWYTVLTTEMGGQPGMSGSKGWEGSRIEVIYRIVDGTGKSIVGRQNGDKYTDASGAEATAGKDYFVRVGFPLDLSAIVGGNGWEMAKRYTYTISLGTVDASNGILLDPDYKNDAGASDTPKIPVDNPKTDPGTPVTPAGLIGFDVAVDNWEDSPQSIK